MIQSLAIQDNQLPIVEYAPPELLQKRREAAAYEFQLLCVKSERGFGDPWLRLTDETDDEYSAFQKYMKLGPSRTMDIFMRRMREAGLPDGEEPLRAFWDEKAFSWCWAERAAAYDKFIRRHREIVDEEKSIEHKSKALSASHNLTNLVDKALSNDVSAPEALAKLEAVRPTLAGPKGGLMPYVIESHKAIHGEKKQVAIGMGIQVTDPKFAAAIAKAVMDVPMDLPGIEDQEVIEV